MCRMVETVQDNIYITCFAFLLFMGTAHPVDRECVKMSAGCLYVIDWGRLVGVALTLTLGFGLGLVWVRVDGRRDGFLA